MGQQDTQPSYEEIKRAMELAQALEYEKALYFYISALERGDTDQMARILKQAETDTVLATMIEETHEAYAEELPPISDESMAKARTIVERVLSEQKEE